MLVVVAVQAEQLPVATVRRIVVVIVVAMMNGKFAQFFAGKIPTAASADMRKQL